MAASYLRFEEMSYPELDALDREKTIFFLSASPLEEHGPHLPFGVDVFVAEHLAYRLIDDVRKEFPDFTLIKFPPLHVGSGGIRWLGTINSKQRTMRKVVYDYCRHLGKYGFKYVLLSNGHGGLGHVVALEEAARKSSRKFNMSVISPSGRIAFEFLTGKYRVQIEQKMDYKFSAEEKDLLLKDSHAGWWETSIMLVINSRLVKDTFKSLESFHLTRMQRFMNKKYPGDVGFRGSPAKASAVYAQAVTDCMIENTMKLVRQWLSGKNMTEDASSPLYKMLFFRTNFDRTLIIISTLFLFLIIYLFFK